MIFPIKVSSFITKFTQQKTHYCVLVLSYLGKSPSLCIKQKGGTVAIWHVKYLGTSHIKQPISKSATKHQKLIKRAKFHESSRKTANKFYKIHANMKDDAENENVQTHALFSLKSLTKWQIQSALTKKISPLNDPFCGWDIEARIE